jgi:hypothetical protein
VAIAALEGIDHRHGQQAADLVVGQRIEQTIQQRRVQPGAGSVMDQHPVAIGDLVADGVEAIEDAVLPRWPPTRRMLTRCSRACVSRASIQPSSG